MNPVYITVGYRNCKKTFDFSIKYTILITMRILTKKILSVLLSFLLVFCGVIPAFSSFENSEHNLKNIIDKEVLNLFKITDSYNSNNGNFIIWIQDLHNDFTTQNRIYKALENLTKKHDFKIYGEGVVDKKLDVSILNSIPNKRIKKETVNVLFKNSILSACEYYVLSNTDKSVNGIEDKKEYLDNLTILERINKNKDFNNYVADNIIKEVSDLKQQNILDRVLSLQILKLNDVNIPDNYPNLQKYQIVSNNLSNINPRKLQSQFKNFLSQSKKYSGLYNLLTLDSDYGYAQVYDYINSTLPELKESKKDKELITYFQSNKLLSEINMVSLLYEKEYYINDLLNNESLDENEREIIDLDNYVKLLKDLINANILPSHYKLLKENKKYFTELIKKYLSNDVLAFALYLLNDKDLFSFFDTNMERNEIFVNNLLKDNSDKIVVAGGFHSDITDKLKQANVSYIVLTPNIGLTHAFNNLFSTTLKYGSNEQIASNILSILSSWQIMFSDKDAFQKEIDEWIENNEELKDNLSVVIDTKYNGFKISVSYADAKISREFDRYKKDVQKQVILSKGQQNLFVDDILKIAKQHYLFGQDVEIRVSDDNSLLNNIVPMSFKVIDKTPIIFINKKFLKELYVNPYLAQSAIKMLYYSSADFTDTDAFTSFISTKYEDLQTIYDITTKIRNSKPSLIFTVKTKIEKGINNIKAGIGNFGKINTIKEISEEDISTEDEKYMAEALKQATLARQHRGFFTSFVQPPIGGFLINADGITGKNYNKVDSVLHAETLTFVDFLKNCLQKQERQSDGRLTEKGKVLMDLLDLVLINGQSINRRVFQDRTYLLSSLGINIDYSKKRSIDTVFAESNAVLKCVNNQLGDPLSSATMYCTLASCNKCSRTMAELGIEKLVYGSFSANKSHKSINTILDAGIKVVGGVFQKQCDERIVNYRFLNLSVLRTKIASAIQFVIRFIYNFRKDLDRFLNYLIANISATGTELLDLKYDISDLQRKIDWSNLDSCPDEVNKLVLLLRKIDAYDDVTKRASMVYVVRNGCEIKIENGNIVFYNKEGKKLDFYINIAKKMVVSERYAEKMEKLAMVRNFADMDDNLAERDKPFNKDMKSVFSTLALYGIGQPIPITGNTLEKANIRLDSLLKDIRALVPTIYIENAAMQYDLEIDEYVLNRDYINNIAHSSIDKDTFVYLRNLFGDMQQEWYDLFVDFINKTKQLRQQNNVTYDDFVNLLLKQHPNYKQHEFIVKIWGGMSREMATRFIQGLCRTDISSGMNINDFKEKMKFMSLLEFSRLYCSQDKQDEKESVRLGKAIKDIEEGKNINKYFDSPVRFVVISRPTVVREAIVAYFNSIIRQKYSDLEVVSTGQTTISIYKKGVDKSIPVKNVMDNGIPASNIIFTGDEFNDGGVDYPIYKLQQNQGNNEMAIINTNYNPFNGEAIALSEIPGFSNDNSSAGNVERNVLLQRLILSIIEENIGRIATDSEYEPVNVAQELKFRIFDNNVVDFETQAQQPDIVNVEDMLKAG